MPKSSPFRTLPNESNHSSRHEQRANRKTKIEKGRENPDEVEEEVPKSLFLLGRFLVFSLLLHNPTPPTTAAADRLCVKWLADLSPFPHTHAYTYPSHPPVHYKW